MKKGFLEPQDHATYLALSQEEKYSLKDKEKKDSEVLFSFNNQWMSHYFQEFLEKPNQNKHVTPYKFLIKVQQR